MSNLLKYRFQRKESDKFESESADSIETQPSSNENSQSSLPESSSQSNVGTPEKRIPQPSVSVKRGAMVIESDSETDSPVKNAPSPWLNKSVGMSVANGHASSTSSLASASPANRNAGSVAFKEEERELYANLATLQEMYPGVTRAKLVEALAMSSNDIDKAVDWIIQKQNDDTSNRKRTYNRIRSYSNDSDNSPDSPVQPAYKKARPLEYSESQESTESSSYPGMSTEEKVQFLVEAFPNFPKDILVLTLQSKDNNLEKASEALSSSGLFPNRSSRPYNNVKVVETEQEPPKLMPMVSPTENVGSIKAYQAARMARMNSSTLSSSGDHSASPKLKSVMGNTSSPNKSRGQRAAARDDLSNDIEDGNYSGQEYSGNSDSEQEDEPSDPVLNFFNAATLEELVAMDGCSKKKAENIKQLRPFTNWIDLQEKLQSSGQLSSGLINSCKQLIRMRGVVRNLMQKCEKIASNMEYIVSEITGKTTIDDIVANKGYVSQQPKMLNENMKLKPYQLVGLNWLNLMHRQHINGILGDEMGLGKTIQTIAFISQLVEEGDKGPHVIIVPSSTIDNWLREMHVWSPSLKVMLYYGSQDERRQVKFSLMEGEEECNVLVTTYNMASGTVEDRALFKKMNFHYAVFDEGHMLKNMGSIRYQSLMRINASRRLLLTGTPLQNNLVELMSLLAFVMPEMFSGKTDQIKKIFTSISSRTGYDSKGDYERQTIAHAKSILKPFFLRRIKREVMQQLPGKVDVIEKVSMAFEQADLYESLKNEFTAAIKEGKDDISKKNRAGAGSAMLMQLRKAANHHLLHRKLYDETKLRQMAKLMVKEPTHVNANVDYVYEDMEVMSDFELHKLCLQYKNIRKFQLDEEQIVDTGKFRYLDDLLPRCKENDSRVLLFSQFTMMLDILEDYLHAKDYVFIRLDGSTPVSERQDLIDKFNNDTDIFVFLLSTKAGGLGINLTAANVVVLHDIDFNPYNDKQAEDRCHRVGQTRDVTVYKLISKNTIEEAMLRCGQAKLQLEQDVTGSAAAAEEENPSDVASLIKEALSIESAE